MRMKSTSDTPKQAPKPAAKKRKDKDTTLVELDAMKTKLEEKKTKLEEKKKKKEKKEMVEETQGEQEEPFRIHFGRIQNFRRRKMMGELKQTKLSLRFRLKRKKRKNYKRK